ncbi:hypothetical protein [Cohnella nanjingensis]|uniref:Lipoprotein n=1 Tax=Cohnella nanjingensis TaxID=1387779 RepID=A0A7X0RQ61_9BACL|nr:hypothetical protein [Cohnella nanjingensis]MBB6671428.1 hypothetical protein [Cohnella nanjingensis]
MKRWAVLYLSLVLTLTGCASQTIIDWVDFIRWSDRTFEGLHEVALVDVSAIGEPIGKVKFRLDGHVHRPNYKSKNGDAAYRNKGTKLYEVSGDGNQGLLAVEDAAAVNGYRLYATREWTQARLQGFEDLAKEQVVQVTVYRLAEQTGKPVKVRTLAGSEAAAFMQLLGQSEPDEYTPASPSEADVWFEAVLETGEPIGRSYLIGYDGLRYYWSPSGTSALPKAIGSLMSEVRA